MNILVSCTFYLIYGSALWLALHLAKPANLLLKIALAMFVFGIYKYIFAWLLSLAGFSANIQAFSGGDFLCLLVFFWLGQKRSKCVEMRTE